MSEDWDLVADLPAVRRLGDLYAAQANGVEMTAALLAQVVKLEGELLLTPAARRRQHVRLPIDPGDAPDAAFGDDEDDPRMRLRVIGPDPREILRRQNGA